VPNSHIFTLRDLLTQQVVVYVLGLLHGLLRYRPDTTIALEPPEVVTRRGDFASSLLRAASHPVLPTAMQLLRAGGYDCVEPVIGLIIRLPIATTTGLLLTGRWFVVTMTNDCCFSMVADSLPRTC
jgi:hypothetical protein